MAVITQAFQRPFDQLQQVCVLDRRLALEQRLERLAQPPGLRVTANASALPEPPDHFGDGSGLRLRPLPEQTLPGRGGLQTKRGILAAIGSNLILSDKKLFIEAQKPFLLLEESHSGSADGKATFEPESGDLNQSQKNCPAASRRRLAG